MLDELLGHSQNKKYLKAVLSSPPTGFLFTGPEGVGKRTFALHWAAELLADRSVLDGRHPDVHVVAPEKNSLKIDQIRTLLEDLHDRPCEGDYKVYILDAADTMTTSAANMLLKPLEEPPPATIFILVATNVNRTLPTIQSRCQELEFQAAGKQDILAFASSRLDDPQRAQLVADLANGSFSLATKLIGGGLLHYREKALEFAERLGNETPSYVMGYLKQQDNIFEFFDIFKTIACDLFFLQNGLTANVVNQDLIESLKPLSSEPFIPRLYDAVRQLAGRQGLIRSNFLFHLQTEMMLLPKR